MFETAESLFNTGLLRVIRILQYKKQNLQNKWNIQMEHFKHENKIEHIFSGFQALAVVKVM